MTIYPSSFKKPSLLSARSRGFTYDSIRSRRSPLETKLVSRNTLGIQSKRGGLFITFEGGECSGKSSQSLMLYKALQSAGINCVLTKEPGGTASAEKIRNILLDSKIKLTPNSQLLLHVAARTEHVNELILPSLKAGKVVICDRFVDSTVAYQHYGSGIPMNALKDLHKTFVHDLMPDMTFVMDMSFDTFKKRIKAKHLALTSSDRYESMPDSFHKRVLLGFKKIARQNKNRCTLIDTNKHSLEEVHEQVMKNLCLTGRLPSRNS